jgi:2-keto-3-deoxy-L-rhamnonate aldolase RhmA
LHPEFPVWTACSRSVRLYCPRHNKFATTASPSKIAAVPAVGAIFIGAAGDLHQYLGVPQESPEVQQARQTILGAYKAHNVACGVTALTIADVEKRLKAGWKLIRTGCGE